MDEFWTFVGNKKNKVWLIYAYDRHTGEIAAYVWGKRNLTTAKQLKAQLTNLGISFDKIACNDWDSFLTAFKHNIKQVGKRFTLALKVTTQGLEPLPDEHLEKPVVFLKS